MRPARRRGQAVPTAIAAIRSARTLWRVETDTVSPTYTSKAGIVAPKKAPVTARNAMSAAMLRASADNTPAIEAPSNVILITRPARFDPSGSPRRAERGRTAGSKRSRSNRLGERDTEACGDRQEHRSYGEAVEGAREGRKLQEAQASRRNACTGQ